MLIYTVGYCAWTSRKDITLVFLDILVQTLQFESLWIPIFHTKPKSFCLDVSGDIHPKETAAGHFHTGCCSKRQWSPRRHCRWPNHGGICSNSAVQFTNDYPASTGTPKTPFVFSFLHFQPGCVNTTEVDIKKSSRMRNPHKTRKVNRCVSCGLAEVSTFNTSISKNPPPCHEHTSPWDSTLIIPFLGRCKQHIPLLIRSQWQTNVHPTRVCPGEPVNLLGCLIEHGWESTYTGESSTQYGWQLFHDYIDGFPSVNFPSLGTLTSP